MIAVKEFTHVQRRAAEKVVCAYEDFAKSFAVAVAQVDAASKASESPR